MTTEQRGPIPESESYRVTETTIGGTVFKVGDPVNYTVRQQATSKDTVAGQKKILNCTILEIRLDKEPVVILQPLGAKWKFAVSVRSLEATTPGGSRRLTKKTHAEPPPLPPEDLPQPAPSEPPPVPPNTRKDAVPAPDHTREQTQKEPEQPSVEISREFLGPGQTRQILFEDKYVGRPEEKPENETTLHIETEYTLTDGHCNYGGPNSRYAKVTKNHVPENQDTCLVGVDSSGRKIAIVSIDGAGGVTGGRAASTDANNGVAKYVKENRLSPKDSLIDVAAHAITEAPEERHGMACVASVIVDGKSGDVGIEHIGDSGVMVLRNFKEIHTTRPHSIAESFQKRPDMQTKLWEPFEINKTFWERIARIIGQPKNEAQLRELQIRIQQSNTPETIFNSPMLHAVERAIAPHQDTTSSERSEFHGENGDLIVQGSDALWKSVSSYEIQKWCVESGGDQQKLEAKIYAMVYERNNSAVPFQIETSLGVFTKVNWKAGKGDNITVLVTKLKNLPERKSAPVPEPVTQQPEETEKEPIEDTVPSEPRTIESEDRGAEEIILKTLERMELKEELGTNFFVKELKKIGWPTHDAEKDKQTLAVVVYTTINLLLGRLRGTFKDKGIRFESDGTPHLGVWNRNKKRATLEEDPDYKGLNQLVLVYRRLTEDSPRGFMNRVRSVWGRTDTKLAAGITVGTIAGIGLSGDNTAPTEIVRPVQSLAERGDHSSQADDSPFIVAEPTKAVGQPREEKETYASKPRFGIEFAPGVTTMHTELRAQKPKPIEQIAVVPQATIPPVKERETELDDPTNHKSKKRRTTPLSTQEPRDRTRASQARKAQTENKIPTTGQNVVTGSGENKDQDERQRMDMNEYE